MPNKIEIADYREGSYSKADIYRMEQIIKDLEFECFYLKQTLKAIENITKVMTK